MMKLLSMLLVAVSTQVAAAQSGATATAKTEAERGLDAFIGAVGAPSITSSLAPDNAFRVVAGNSSSHAQIKLSLPRTRGDGTVSSISLIAQAPLAKDGGDTTLASLDGLSGGTTLEIRYSSSRLGGVRRGSGASALAFCEQRQLKELFLRIKGNKAEDWECDTATVQSLVSHPQLGAMALRAADYEAFELLHFEPTAAFHSWGIGARGGYQDFQYHDRITLAETQKRHQQWSVSAFYAYAPVRGLRAFTATLTAQSAYKNAKSRTACLALPPAGDALLTCVSGAIGEPTRKTTSILNLEWRQQISNRFALSLQASRDFRNKLSAVQVPLYFVGDGKGGLTAGVNLGWTNEDHKGRLGVFVGQAFGIFD